MCDDLVRLSEDILSFISKFSLPYITIVSILEVLYMALCYFVE